MRQAVLIRLVYFMCFPLLAGCATRYDVVFTEKFIEEPCSGSILCEKDRNFVLVKRIREVSAGVARNTAGTLIPGCAMHGKQYICEQGEVGLPRNKLLSNENYDLLLQGYQSSISSYSPNPCEVFSTTKSQNDEYLIIEDYMNFAHVELERVNIENHTGSPLEDYTAVHFVCDRECYYDEDRNINSNEIHLVLSKSRRSGRLDETDIEKRQASIVRLINDCRMEMI